MYDVVIYVYVDIIQSSLVIFNNVTLWMKRQTDGWTNGTVDQCVCAC